MKDYPRTIPSEKTGSLEDQTDSAHILSYEVLIACLEHKIGPKYGEENWNKIQRILNQEKNLRIKSQNGNRVIDRKLDGQIIEIINGFETFGFETKLTNEQAVNRLKHAWESVQNLEFPIKLKELIRECFSKIRDQNGNVIIRKNSSLGECKEL